MCFFFKIEAQYLAKIINLKNFRGDPINVGDLRKLFGYKQSIKDFSRIAIPLYDLLKEPKEIKTNTRRSSSKTSIGQHSSKDFIVWTPHH